MHAWNAEGSVQVSLGRLKAYRQLIEDRAPSVPQSCFP